MSEKDHTVWSDISKSKPEPDGSYKRRDSTFRNFIEKGGTFEPEKGRYRLYVSYACPWATRTLILRKLKGLEDIIPVSVVSPRMGEHGWPFASVDAFPEATDDPVYGSEHLKDLYLRADPHYRGKFTVPTLWDMKTHTIVNNESSEIIRMLNSAFNDFLPEEKNLDYYPEPLRKNIDELNQWIYSDINDGVYRTGFATSQEAYSKAVESVFKALDKVERILAQSGDYLVGGTLTEADIRLWVTVVRFDPVYVGHFKCNKRTIRDGYPNIHRWMRKLYWTNSAFKDCTNFEHIKTHYYWSHPMINPRRIIPVGPEPNILPLSDFGVILKM